MTDQEKKPVTNFADRLIESILEKKSYLCVGLDPQPRYFPPHLLQWAAKTYGPGPMATAEAILRFNMSIIDASFEFAACYKPQAAFYEPYGEHGIRALRLTMEYLKSLEALYTEDAKKEDGGDTSEIYAEGHMGEVDVIGADGQLVKMVSPYDADAITITPWIDDPNFAPFVKVVARRGKGVFIVTKTSFKPASRLQEMEDKDGTKAWMHLADYVQQLNEGLEGKYGYGPIGAVMGATFPDEARIMQRLLPRSFKLVPGYKAQGGGEDDAVISVNSDGFGAIINNSRASNYAYLPQFKSGFACDPKQFASAIFRACQKCRDDLNAAVLRKNGRLPW